MISRSTTVRLTAAAATAALLVFAAPAADAQSGGDARSQRQHVRQQQAANASRLDALRATDAQVHDALAALRRNVAAQQGAVEDAQRAVASAERDIAEAQAAVDSTEAQISALEDRQQTLAVDNYIRSGTNAGDVEVLNEGDPLDVAERQALLDLTSGRNADIADQLVGAREDLRDARARAREAAQRAGDERAQAQQELADLQAAEARQRAFADDVNQRINARLAEAANLEQLDATLSAQIAAQQVALAAQVPQGGGPVHVNPVSTGSVSLSTVGGITVASSIADNLAGLLNASRAAGLSLGGGGYRSADDQMAVRRANCPDPFNSPPSACSPPTALPGSSLHERGLAIDFTSAGHLISSHSDPAYQWLAGNASTYGFYNLASEPWHWSTTGG